MAMGPWLRRAPVPSATKPFLELLGIPTAKIYTAHAPLFAHDVSSVTHASPRLCAHSLQRTSQVRSCARRTGFSLTRSHSPFPQPHPYVASRSRALQGTTSLTQLSPHSLDHLSLRPSALPPSWPSGASTCRVRRCGSAVRHSGEARGLRARA